MEIKHSIFRRGRKGSGDGKSYRKPWTLRFTFTDESGRARQKTYQFSTRVDATDARSKLEAAIRKTNGRNAVGDKMTFRDLAEYAKRTFYRPAEIINGRKIAGIKSCRQTHNLIDTLVEYFGKRRISTLTRSDLDGFKSWRLKQGDRRGKLGQLPTNRRKPVSLSTVNRSLATFKHMIKFAYAEGWISRDITLGSKAIDPDAEKARTRTLTESEEEILLASCGGDRVVTYTRSGKEITSVIRTENTYLRALVLLGLDAGLRRNEALKLEWQDIDFDRGFIHVRSQHTKTQKGRNVPLRRRLRDELRRLPTFAASGKVFPFADFKRSWATALRIAGIEGLTFHDLRRTFITRLSVKGVPLAVAGKLAGHSTLATTQKHYVSIDDLEIVEGVRLILDSVDDESTTANGFVN
ncbi:MAG: tyrosine-type recombinase/integrase [Acidobacteriota bacterium]|nr:MAG: tyrosine-type recombinase/integrase [Acidobacteriota bacterium]